MIASDREIGRASPDSIHATGNIVSFFEHWAKKTPDRPALVFPRKKGKGLAYEVLSFGELDLEARRLATGLRALGLVKGDRVLILIPISRALYALMLAVTRIGCTSVFLDPWVGSAQRKAAADLIQPKAFAGIPLAHLLRMSKEFSRIPIKLVTGAARGTGWLFGTTLEGLAARSAPEEGPPVRCDLDESALITFTTGSTGRPKGSDRTHAFINAQGDVLDRHLARIPGDVDMPALPIFVLQNLASGVPSVLPLVDWKRVASVDPAVVIDEIADWKVTSIGGSPAYLLPIARHCVEKELTLDTVRGVVTGGAPVSPALLTLLQRACPRAKVEVIYGSTEAEPISSIDAREVLAETAALTDAGRGNCVGGPIPDVELKVVRPDPSAWQLDGRGWDAVEVPQGQVGELLVTGPHVQKTYWNDPDSVRANKVTGPDGRVWHRLGDLGYLDERGRVWLVGRIHNAVVDGARVLYPIQVESRAESVAGVKKAALLSWNDRPALVLEPADPIADRAALIASVSSHLAAGGMSIEQVRCVSAIPLDPRHNAKVELPRLRELLAKEGA